MNRFYFSLRRFFLCLYLVKDYSIPTQAIYVTSCRGYSCALISRNRYPGLLEDFFEKVRKINKAKLKPVLLLLLLPFIWYSAAAQCPSVISKQPVGGTACQGMPFTFTVTLAMPAGAFYTWYQDLPTVGPPRPLPRSITRYQGSSPSFTIPQVQTSDNGTYRVEIRTQCGTIISQDVQLVVASLLLPIPDLGGQTIVESSQTLCKGQTVSFKVFTGFSPTPTPSIQWQLSTDSGVSWTTTDQHGTDFFLSNQDGLLNGVYKVRAIASNACGTDTSDVGGTTAYSMATPVISVTDSCSVSTLSTAATGSLLWSTGASSSSIRVSQPGQYTVTQTLNGCISDAGVVTAAPKPTPPTPVINVLNECGSSKLSIADPGTVLWSTGATTPSITITQNGSYTATITDGSGCRSGESAVDVSVKETPAKPTITASGTTTFCTGGNVTLSAPPGFSSYLWSNGATTQSINVTEGGLYTVAVTNSNGCSSITSDATTVTVNALPAKPIITTSGATSFCTGGSVALSAPTGFASYLWSNGATTQSINVTESGSYTVIVTNSNGCTSAISDAITVTVNALPAKPTITANGATTFCTGGSVTLSAPGGFTSYLWSNGATTQSINVTEGGSYTVVVTNSNGCSSITSDATTVTVNALPAKPTINTSGATTFCIGGSVTLSAPTGFSSYLWSNGATTQSISVTESGSYTVAVTNSNGCSSATSDATTVTVNALPAKPIITANGATSFCTGGNVTLSAPEGFASYLWSNGATTQSINVTEGGSCTVAVTNSSGCSSATSDATTITVNALPGKPTITAVGATNFCTGGNVTLSAPTGFSSYLWSNGATTQSINVTESGSYAVAVTNNNGCSSAVSDATTVTVNASPAKPAITANGATSFCNGGNVTLSAPTGFSSYLWSNGATTQSINVTVSGSYSVITGSGTGCTSQASDATTVTVNALPDKPVITASGATSFCPGGNVTLSAPTGFTSYLWSNGATTKSINVTASGSYTVIVINSNGCSSATSDATTVTVNAPPAKPAITANGATSFCTGGNVTLSAPGDFASYLWSNGATTQSINVTVSGSYSVAVTNSNGCSSATSDATTVTVNALPTKPIVTASGATTFCTGGNVTLSAPTGFSSYLWSNGATTQSINVTESGLYTVAVTNSNGCNSTTSDATTVTVNALPAKPTITASGATTFCTGGSVTLSAPEGFASYLWSNGATTQSINVTVSGSYSVIAGSGTGCTSPASDATTVTVNALPAKPVITANGATAFCTGGNVTLSAPGGFASYLWSNGATTQSINVTVSGSYSVAVTNSNGCSSATSDATTITVNALPAKPVVTANGATSFCTGDNVTLSAPTGFSSYLWSNGATTQSINVTVSGSYSVIAGSGTGCTSPASNATTVTVNTLPAKPVVTANGATSFCTGGNVTLSAPAGFTSYLWSNGATTQSINVTVSGSYSVKVSNGTGCTSQASDATTVTVNALPAKPAVTANGAITFCIGGNVTLSAPTGFTSYLWSNGATTQSINVTSGGSYSVKVSNGTGCSSPASDATIVTVNALPAKPVITAGGPLSFAQGGSVTLSAPSGFASYLWNNGATTASVTVSTSGTYSVVVRNSSGCSSQSSDPVTVTVQTVAATLSVSHMDADYGQLTNNNIRPYLQVNNDGSSAVAYKDLTIRYWLTVEDFSPMTNLAIDWAQLGTAKVKMKYVKLGQPHNGAFGYIEYTFDASAGNLAAKSNSGPIQSRAGKSDWTNFNEADDYSYASSGNYSKNSKITLYRSGTLVWGTEPAAISSVQSLKSYSKDNSSGTTTNTISNWIKLNNEGNIPVSYKDITIRYWFTADGNKPLNYAIDYALLGNNNVKGKFVKLPSALPNADTYLEISFAAPDSLYPVSSTGNIQHRISKSDWSNFNQLNDHSYKAGQVMMENVRVTVYLKNTLVYGVEPSSGAKTAPGEVVNKESALDVTVINNPVINNEAEFIIRGAEGKNVQVSVVDVTGKVIGVLPIGKAGASEHKRISLRNAVAGVFYLKVIADSEMKTVSLLKLN